MPIALPMAIAPLKIEGKGRPLTHWNDGNTFSSVNLSNNAILCIRSVAENASLKIAA
jgi:hypothetical protein